MTDQDKKQFALMMNGVGAAFRCDVSKETMGIFFEYLRDQSLDAVRFAVDKVITTNERFPVVKTMRELSNSYRPPVKHAPPRDYPQIAEFTQEELDKYSGGDSEEIFKAMLKEATKEASV